MPQIIKSFEKHRKWLESDLSNKVKAATNQDLFDWLLWLLLLPLGILIIFSNAESVTSAIGQFIFWFTALVVVKYTKETHHLKKVAQRQLEISEKTQMNELLPIVSFTGQAIIQGNAITLFLCNIGRGFAKNITVQVEGHTIIDGVLLLPGDDLYQVIVPNELREVIKEMTSDSARNEINMNIIYYDIYERRIDINGIIFTKDEDRSGNRFVMQPGAWKFHFYF